MSSPVYLSLKTMLDQMLSEREKIKAQLDELDTVIADIKGTIAKVSVNEKPNAISPALKGMWKAKKQARAIRKNAVNPTKVTIAKKVKKILEESYTPMSRAEIFQKLKEQGTIIVGKDPEMVLSTMLWRAGEAEGIVNEKGKGYFLKDKDYGMFG